MPSMPDQKQWFWVALVAGAAVGVAIIGYQLARGVAFTRGLRAIRRREQPVLYWFMMLVEIVAFIAGACLWANAILRKS